MKPTEWWITALKNCRVRAAIASLLVLAVVIQTGPAAAVALTTEWGNIEGMWLFRIDPKNTGENDGWHQPDINDSSWKRLQVPGLWEPQGITQQPDGPAAKPSANVLWASYDGAAWYRLHFTSPSDWRGKRLMLLLGQVDDYDRTFVNGQLIGQTGRDVKRAVTIPRRYTIPPDIINFDAENILSVRVFDGGGPGGIIGPTLSLLPQSKLEEPMTIPGDDRPLRERFNDPPASCRILKIVHNLPDEGAGQEDLIRGLIQRGFGGMATNVSFDGYVESEDNWRAFESAIRKAKQAGMALWLYDELGYPSGTAGGIVLRDHPQWQARGLLIARASTTADPVQLDVPPGELCSARAYPDGEGGIDPQAGRDLKQYISDGKLSWTPPDGRWQVMVITEAPLFEGTHSAVSLHDNKPYINLLMTEPTRRFLEVTHQQYAQRLGDDLGRYFVSTFTDEPSLMSMFFKQQPYTVLPWSPGLAEQFRQQRGYDIKPKLPLLAADGSGAARLRYDFWLTVAELVADRYFGQIQDWCGDHNIASGGHLLLEEPLTAHVCLYGDLMRCTRRLDAPSIDCLTSIPAQVPWRVARMASSAAELNGTDLTMCETSDHSQRYRPPGDDRPVTRVTEEQIRGTCNRLMVNGINTITSYYSFQGVTTGQLQRLNDYVGRCCTMLRGGHQVTDIAVLYPIHSVWPKFIPSRKGAAPDAERIQRVFERVCDSLFQHQRDFTFIDAQSIENAALQGGRLVHDELSWRVVILPAADTLPMKAWEQLQRFYEDGGAIISVGALPQNSHASFPSAHVQKLANDMFADGRNMRAQSNQKGGASVFLPSGALSLLPYVLDRIIAADVNTTADDSPLRVTHRHIDDHEVYFLINDSNEACHESVEVAAGGNGEMWNPATGDIADLTDGNAIDIDLEPYGGTFLRFAEAKNRPRRQFDGKKLPGIAFRPLPAAEPAAGNGEFVDAGIQPTEIKGGAGWRAKGTLTKSDVDTFLFVRFQYQQPVDLSDAVGLVLRTEVPRGQKTPTDLLVILTDDSGGQYIANTGRSLATAGYQETYVPFSSFNNAPWADDANGRLDRDAVSAVAVGWGGYFGTDGETIEFSLQMPKTVTIEQ